MRKILTIIILAIAVIGITGAISLSEWQEKVSEWRKHFNQVATELYNEGRSRGNSAAYMLLAQELYDTSKSFISVLESKPYISLDESENDLLENARATKENMSKYMDGEIKARDPKNPNRRPTYAESVNGLQKPKN